MRISDWSSGVCSSDLFSTPAALSWLSARTAAIMTDDHVLEPSAGTGMLAAHAIAAGASVSLNERDPCRAALLSLVTSRAVTTHDAEFINDRLPADVRPTVVRDRKGPRRNPRH